MYLYSPRIEQFCHRTHSQADRDLLDPSTVGRQSEYVPLVELSSGLLACLDSILELSCQLILMRAESL